MCEVILTVECVDVNIRDIFHCTLFPLTQHSSHSNKQQICDFLLKIGRLRRLFHRRYTFYPSVRVRVSWLYRFISRSWIVGFISSLLNIIWNKKLFFLFYFVDYLCKTKILLFSIYMGNHFLFLYSCTLF